MGEDYIFDNIKTRNYQSTLYDRYLKRNNIEKVYEVKIYDDIKIDIEKLKISFYRIYVRYVYLFGKLPPKFITRKEQKNIIKKMEEKIY